MIYKRPYPNGVDIPIQDLQEYIYDNLDLSKYNSYARVFKTEVNGKSNQFEPVWYINKKDGIETLFDDKNDLSSFFICADKYDIVDYNSISTNISIIFQAKLDKIYPDASIRPDEDFRATISKLLINNPFGFKFISIETGVNNVYREFDKTKLNFPDISNYHVVRYNLLINYNLNC